MKISVITLDFFQEFQKTVDVSPQSNITNRKISNRKININYRLLSALIKSLDSLRTKLINSPVLTERITGIIESLTSFNCETQDSIRYIKTDYCVKQDKVYPLEKLGLMNTSSNYQVVYDTDSLLAEILAMGWGLNSSVLKEKIKKVLNGRDYTSFSKQILGHEFGIIDVSCLYKIDPNIEATVIDLNSKVQSKSLKFHSSVWNDYKVNDYSEVLNKAFLYTIWDLQQYLINQMILSLDSFKKELDSSIVTSVTSYTHGSFVVQSNEKVDYPVFEIIDNNGFLVCSIEPTIYSRNDCLTNCLTMHGIGKER